MRLKAILAEVARKRYPLSIMIIVVGILAIPFPYLFIHFGLELNDFWYSALGICAGVVLGSLIIGLGSLVEDIHDISMHTMGYDLEFGELQEDDFEEEYYDEPGFDESREGEEPCGDAPAAEAPDTEDQQ